MKIPFIDLPRLTRGIAAEVQADWGACLQQTEFVNGPRAKELEAQLAQVLGVPHVVTCSSGSNALIIALHTLGIKPGMKVAIPNLTFWATYESVIHVGATPILIDIDPNDLQICLEELTRAHDEWRFDACILVHLFGWASARLHEIRQFCQARDVVLLEDAAQSIGVQLEGKPLLANTAAATLSFHPAKVLGGAMDGGAITFQSAEHATLARCLREHGRTQHYAHAHVGYNARMAELQAAFLLRLLPHLPEILKQRRSAFALYRELLASQPRLKWFGPPSTVEGNAYLCVLTTPQAGDTLAKQLEQAGVGTRRTYPCGLSDQSGAISAIRYGTLTHTREFCRHVINLPLFFGILESECRLVCNTLMALY